MWDQVDRPARPEHVAAVVRLALAAGPRCGTTTVVAVDGRSGAGKTTLALGVRDALTAHGSTGLVHLDSIYPGWDGLAVTPGLLTDEVLLPLSRGEAGRYRLWSWVHDRWKGARDVPPCRFLVVEGCGSAAGPAAPLTSVVVWVEAPRDLRRARGIARDGAEYERHWQRWADQEDALFASDGTRARADLVVDTSSL